MGIYASNSHNNNNFCIIKKLEVPQIQSHPVVSPGLLAIDHLQNFVLSIIDFKIFFYYRKIYEKQIKRGKIYKKQTKFKKELNNRWS